jgi:hypothetical protein
VLTRALTDFTEYRLAARIFGEIRFIVSSASGLIVSFIILAFSSLFRGGLRDSKQEHLPVE